VSDSVQRRQKYHKSDEYRCKKYKKITGSVLLVEETFSHKSTKVSRNQRGKKEYKSVKYSVIKGIQLNVYRITD
jgi:predicted GIY-YIG superfamily endonuclease